MDSQPAMGVYEIRLWTFALLALIIISVEGACLQDSARMPRAQDQAVKGITQYGKTLASIGVIGMIPAHGRKTRGRPPEDHPDQDSNRTTGKRE